MTNLVDQSRQNFSQKFIHLKLFRRFWKALQAYHDGKSYEQVLKLFYSNLCVGKINAHRRIGISGLNLDGWNWFRRTFLITIKKRSRTLAFTVSIDSFWLSSAHSPLSTSRWSCISLNKILCLNLNSCQRFWQDDSLLPWTLTWPITDRYSRGHRHSRIIIKFGPGLKQ